MREFVDVCAGEKDQELVDLGTEVTVLQQQIDAVIHRLLKVGTEMVAADRQEGDKP